VTIETDIEVTDIATANGAVEAVITDDGTIDADLVINATGPWANRINDFVGLSTPIRHSLGPIVVLESQRAVSLPFTFFEEGLYLREEGDSQLFAGVHNRYEDAEQLDPAHARAVDEEMYLEIADVADEYLPQHADLDVSNEWVGLRSLTPDDRPLVGESSVDGFYLAAGMGGYGVTLAPAIGEIVAEDVLGRASSPHEQCLSPERFPEMETAQ
jgi:sarcosine oxidase subunit beta